MTVNPHKKQEIVLGSELDTNLKKQVLSKRETEKMSTTRTTTPSTTREATSKSLAPAETVLSQKEKQVVVEGWRNNYNAGDLFEKINDKQLIFLHFKCLGQTDKIALKEAGYRSPINNWKKNPKLWNAFQFMQKESVKNAVASPEDILEVIWRNVKRAEEEGKFTAVFKGCELMGKHFSMWVERHEITGKDGDAIQIEQTKRAVEDFTRTIDGIARTLGTKGSIEDAETGGSGVSELSLAVLGEEGTTPS